MSVLKWDQDTQRLYETGVEKGVLYVKEDDGAYGTGVAWNGLTGVTESPSGAEPTALYANNKKYLNLMSAEEFGGTIEAYTYPDEFAACNGEKELAPGVTIGQQTRKGFGFCYKTLIGNDAQGDSYGYKLHIVYNCLVSPSEKAYETVNESPNANEMSWEFTTTPVEVTGGKPTSIVVINSKKVDATKLAALEAKLYGSESEEPTLPSVDEIAEMLKTA